MQAITGRKRIGYTGKCVSVLVVDPDDLIIISGQVHASLPPILIPKGRLLNPGPSVIRRLRKQAVFWFYDSSCTVMQVTAH